MSILLGFIFVAIGILGLRFNHNSNCAPHFLIDLLSSSIFIIGGILILINFS